MTVCSVCVVLVLVGLVQSGVIAATQEGPYKHIMISRGDNF